MSDNMNTLPRKRYRLAGHGDSREWIVRETLPNGKANIIEASWSETGKAWPVAWGIVNVEDLVEIQPETDDREQQHSEDMERRATT